MFAAAVLTAPALPVRFVGHGGSSIERLIGLRFVTGWLACTATRSAAFVVRNANRAPRTERRTPAAKHGSRA